MSVLIPGKLLYLATPRTASVATCEALATLPNAIKPRNHHAELDDFPEYGGELIITTVRNHWDTVATWWLLNLRRISLYNFIDQYNHSHYARDNKLFWLHEKVVQRVLKYENLEIDLADVLGQEIKLPRLNITEGKKHWINHYSREAYEKVWAHFHEEITYYGYEYKEYLDACLL